MTIVLLFTFSYKQVQLLLYLIEGIIWTFWTVLGIVFLFSRVKG
jgi:hypothetical protein